MNTQYDVVLFNNARYCLDIVKTKENTYTHIIVEQGRPLDALHHFV